MNQDFPSLPSSPDSLAPLVIPQVPPGFRSGFACILGRPNVGKSTLTNAMVGQKVAITSKRPETTRRVIRGVVHRSHGQLVLVDTPGYHRPRTLLGQRLNDMVRQTLANVDVVVFCIPANQKVGPGDRFITEQLQGMKTPVIAVVTKTDLVSKPELVKQLQQVSELADFHAIVPVSARRSEGVEELVQVLFERMEEGPPLYPDGELTDEPEQVMMAEFIREAALEGLQDELPHSLAVQVEEVIEREAVTKEQKRGEVPTMVDVHVNIYVERDSQKGIVIGKKGARLKHIGTVARRQIEALLGRKVFLELHVRTAKDWQKDPKMLGRLGF